MKVITLIILVFLLPVNGFAAGYVSEEEKQAQIQAKWEYEKILKKAAPSDYPSYNWGMFQEEIVERPAFAYEPKLLRAMDYLVWTTRNLDAAIIAVRGSKQPLLSFALMSLITDKKGVEYDIGRIKESKRIIPQSLLALEEAKKALSDCGITSDKMIKHFWDGEHNGTLGVNLTPEAWTSNRGVCSISYAMYVNFYVMDKILTHLVEKNSGNIEQAIREYGQALGKGEDFVDDVEWTIFYLAFKK
jgi:hypothetical protein